jgi:uncharacterized protein
MTTPSTRRGMCCLMKPLLILVVCLGFGAVRAAEPVRDQFSPLPAHALRFNGYLNDTLENSLNHWNKGVVPYAALVQMFRTGRGEFAQGEMWGKAVQSGSLFYRYTQDSALRDILRKTVADMLSTKRANGSLSCSDISKQPDGTGGDLWERKYVLLGLYAYYRDVEQDPAVLQAMINEADVTIAQIGPPPKVRIVDQGWSPNHIESSTILEPMLLLYKLTGKKAYLDFAKYIVEDEGGAKGFNIIQQALDNTPPEKIGGSYPKAYEMMSLFEGVLEYYRATGDERWKQATLNLYHNIATQEITIIGNGGGDQPYHPGVAGEAWDNTAIEQTNPKIKRMMETCAGVTWLKLCSQILCVTGDPSAADKIERYTYNGLIGAMKPTGDGFSYVNLLNGVKTDPHGWGGKIDNVYVTCCNLNGPIGLAYLPMVALMNSASGPAINLYNAASAVASTPAGRNVRIDIETDYPKSGVVILKIDPDTPEKFTLHLRIPAWSATTSLSVNGQLMNVTPGTYAAIDRQWQTGDRVELQLDMRCRLIDGPHGSNRDGDNRVALVRGPVVLARDENIDPDYDKPVAIVSKDGYVDVASIAPTLKTTRLQFSVPILGGGSIQLVDYASVDCWSGKHICTWMPKAGAQ